MEPQMVKTEEIREWSNEFRLRKHRTTGRQPLEMFSDELPCLINYRMMKTKPETIARMSEYLGLKNLAVQHTELIKRAHEQQMGLIDFLEMALREETALKRECGIRYRIRESRLSRPYKLLSDFDFGFQPKLCKSLVMDLSTMEFIKQHESILLIGGAGEK